MNKQEKQKLIQELLAIGGCDADTDWADGYDAGVDNAINVVEKYLKQLDESKKVVVPKFVAKKIESYGSALEMLANEYFDQSSEEVDSDELACWIDGNADLFFKAWVCGYEVEKEPLYEVVFMETDGERYLLARLGEHHFEIIPESENEGYHSQRFTKREIQAINKDYLKFAEEVEDTQHGQS